MDQTSQGEINASIAAKRSSVLVGQPTGHLTRASSVALQPSIAPDFRTRPSDLMWAWITLHDRLGGALTP